MKTTYTLIALLTIAVTSGALAAGMNRGAGQNSNAQPPAFSQYDLDGDGSVSEQEFNQARAERIAQRSAEGRLMKNIGENTLFSAIDKDADGVISNEEFTAHQAVMRADMQSKQRAMQDRRGKGAMAKGERGKGGKWTKSNRQRPAFADFDSNGDSLISSEEFDAFRAERQQARAEEGRRMANANRESRFATLDSDGDGFISQEEFMAQRGSGKGRNR